MEANLSSKGQSSRSMTTNK